MADLSIKVGKTYYLAAYRAGFGPYWMIVKVLEIKEKVSRHITGGTDYSIKYRKIKSHYDDTYAAYGSYKVKKDVWCHGETKNSISYRFLEV